MDNDTIVDLILENTDTKEPIPSELLWQKCGKPNKNKFYQILNEMRQKEWLRRIKDGIIRVDFLKEGFIDREDKWIREWCKNSLKAIARTPLMKEKKSGELVFTKSGKKNLRNYFWQIDYSTLNILNRNFLAYRLKLITPTEYRENLRRMEKLFDYIMYGLINDYKSYKKEIINNYLGRSHRTGFKV